MTLALLAAVLAAGPSAEARWGLRWQAPLECVQAAQLARAVEARLTRPVFGPDAEFTIDGVLHSGTRPRWKAQLTLVDARGTVLGAREVSSDEAGCAAMNDQVTLIVAVMIDPRAALGAAAPDPAPAPAPAVEPAPPAPAPEPPPVETVRQPAPAALVAEPGGTRGEVLFGATGTLGLLLSAVPGAQIQVHTRWGPRTAVEWWVSLFPRNALSRDGALAAAHGLQTAVTLCPLRAEGGPALFVLCGGLAGTLLLTYSEGYQQGLFGLTARPDAVARARVRLAFGTFALSLGVMGGVGPVRPQLLLLKPSGASAWVSVGSWGWGAAELSLGAVWR